MKKRGIKNLSLNKNKVSNLIDAQLKGGTSGSTELTYFACTLRCGGTTGPAPSANPGGSECKCK